MYELDAPSPSFKRKGDRMKYVFMMMLSLCLFAVGCDDTDDYPPGDQNAGANDDQDDGANDDQNDGANDDQDGGANDDQDDGANDDQDGGANDDQDAEAAGKLSGAPQVYSTPLVE